jgi:hypothetical protein
MTANDIYDTPWKRVLTQFLPDFLAFFFPAAHADIDWSQGYTSLDAELQKLTPAGETGRRFADKLIEVRLHDGAAARVLIHIEVQGTQQATFARRMWVYHYRIADTYGDPPVSLAVLADDNTSWQPTGFSYGRWGCELTFRFPTVKLLRYVDQRSELEASTNPFAVVVLAHLASLQTRDNPNDRADSKFAILRRMYRLGIKRHEILDLYRFIDWVLALPQDLEAQVLTAIQALPEEQRMTYISYAERKGREEGREEGQHLMVLRVLTKVLGSLTPEAEARVAALDAEQRIALLVAAGTFRSSADFEQWLSAHAP